MSWKMPEVHLACSVASRSKGYSGPGRVASVSGEGLRSFLRLWASAILVAATAAHGQTSPPLQRGLDVKLTLSDEQGRPTERVKPGEQFALRIHLKDAATGAPVAGLLPQAWLRRPGPGRGACTEAGRALRATGRLARTDVALTGTAFLVLGSDRRLAIMEPDVSLATSNIAALVPLDEVPGSVIGHRDGMAFVSLPQRGEVLRIDVPTGKVHRHASGLARPGAMLDAAAGRLWVATQAGEALLLDRNGKQVSRLQGAGGPVTISAAGPLHVVVMDAGGAAQIANRDTGALETALPAATLAGPFAAGGGVLVSKAETAGISIRYVDAPQIPQNVTLSAAPEGIAVSTDGRYAAVWSNTERRIDLIDVALARRLRTFAADDEVDEAMFAGEAAFFSYRSRAVISVINLLLLKDGDAAVRDIRLTERSRSEEASARQGALLASLAPASAVLVARPAGQTLFTVMAGGGLANSPMSALALKTASPTALVALRRSLAEIEAGVYEASTKLPSGGAWELVMTTGILGTTSCIAIDAEGAAPVVPELPRLIVDMPSAPRPRQTTRLRIKIANLEPAKPIGDSVDLLIAAFDGGWSQQYRARRSGSDFVVDAIFPWAGIYSIAALRGAAAPTTVTVPP